MKTSPLHPRFGKILEGIDLREATPTRLYPEIRDLFERHSALLIRDQDLSPPDHLRLAELFGPLENREAMAAGRDMDFEIPSVSNETDDGVHDEASLDLLNLQANMLWHTDSTFLPVPALVNILLARVIPSKGGETELASTRAAWADMPEAMKATFRDAIIWHRLSNSRAQLSGELAARPDMTRWPDRPWRAIWPNPVTGEEALYVASHAFAIEGRGFDESRDLLAEAIAFCTRPEYVYSHVWRPGDVLIWDERAMLHRGQPWPYEEPRTLSSICCSVTDGDGLETVRLV